MMTRAQQRQLALWCAAALCLMLAMCCGVWLTQAQAQELASDGGPSGPAAIPCSIFAAMPVLEAARDALSDSQPPEQSDFKARLAFEQAREQKRRVALRDLDALIGACKRELAHTKAK